MDDAVAAVRRFTESEGYHKLSTAMLTSYTAMAAWCDVAVYFGGPVATRLVSWQTSLTGREVALELGVLALILSLYFLRRFLKRKQYLRRGRAFVRALVVRFRAYVSRKYNGVVRWVEHKSKVAALALPHACFAAGAYVFALWFPETTRAISSGSQIEVCIIAWRSLWSMACISHAAGVMKKASIDRTILLSPSQHTPAPAGTTAASPAATSQPSTPLSMSIFGSGAKSSVRRRRTGQSRRGGATPDSCQRHALSTPGAQGSGEVTEESVRHELSAAQDGVRTNLMYWVVLAFVLAMHRVAVNVPFVGSLMSFFQYDGRLQSVYTFVLIWLQLPIGAAKAAYDVIVPAIENRVGKFKKINTTEVLTMLRVITHDTYDHIVEVSRDGWILASLVFLVMPGYFTKFGCILSGLVYPTFCSIRLLGHGVSKAITTQVRWLKYWVVYALLIVLGHSAEEQGVWSWVLFGHHLHLLAVVWLQLPYFRGAVHLYDRLLSLLATLLDFSDAEGGAFMSPLRRGSARAKPSRRPNPSSNSKNSVRENLASEMLENDDDAAPRGNDGQERSGGSNDNRSGNQGTSAGTGVRSGSRGREQASSGHRRGRRSSQQQDGSTEAKEGAHEEEEEQLAGLD